MKSYKSEEKTEIDECEITQEPEVEAALVSMDPRNGEILAWVGGYDFNRSQFDRVTQAKRQPGSGFKPFLYAAALDGPYTASHIVYDTPIVIEKTWEKEEIKDAIPDKEILENDEDEKEYWKPHNYSEEFYGATTLRTGLEKSRNIISIHVLEETGTRNVIRLARRMGVKSQLTNTLSLALGASEVSLLEMVQAYGGFANLGVVADPLKISNILNRSHQIQKEFYPSLRRAIRPETAYLISNLLQGVIQRGTGIKARRLNRPMGGKTGTTNSYYDTWFNGFTPQMVTIVWVGMDLLEPISQHATGASTALPIWIDYMEDAIKDYEPTDFSVPDNIVFEKICKDTGLLATEKCPNTLIEAYREGTEPLQFCDKHQLIKREYRQGVNLDWDADLIFNDQLSGEKPDEELDEIIGDTDEASELSLDQFESSDESSSPRSSNTM